MAWTQADIDALDTAYKTGARRVRKSDGSEVEFQTISDYQTLRAFAAAEVYRAAGTRRIRQVRLYGSKGL